jgi:hypothetical protein
MNLRAMPAVTNVTSRASHAGRVKGDRSDQKRYPGPPDWGLGHEPDNLIPVKNLNCWETLDDSLGDIRWSWKAVFKKAKAHKGL